MLRCRCLFRACHLSLDLHRIRSTSNDALWILRESNLSYQFKRSAWSKYDWQNKFHLSPNKRILTRLWLQLRKRFTRESASRYGKTGKRGPRQTFKRTTLRLEKESWLEKLYRRVVNKTIKFMKASQRTKIFTVTLYQRNYMVCHWLKKNSKVFSQLP